MSDNDKRRLIQELVRDRLPALVLYAKQWKHTCAEDVVQDAFLKLYQQNPVPAEPLAWLFAVIRNDSNNYIRSQKRRKKREQERPLFHSSPKPDSTVDSQGLIDALQSLPQEYREIITAKIWGGLSFDQIAAIYEMSRSGAHRKYHEGLELLRKIVESE